ncbi:iron donor protein CyaY [Salinivibrio sp. ES.052]|uniref:iron donor protein CyaY n=1 Tax=Salinivibrio sp. ES.052 TaxID=1882823 RepID=UPI00092C8821|nr:iron donor protein CyaY [Salinivibrio sp. ES.052]SIO23605.1 CyaY protein [Salinivibrio sp. ES.052]
MNTTEYHQLVDLQMQTIEEGIDDSGADIDYESVGNVMTLEFDDGSQIIINRQEPMQEIWVASKSGGFHFALKDGEWTCSKTGLVLMDLVQQECSKHAGEPVSW